MKQTAFLHHRGPVTCAAQLPNNHKIITSGYDSAVALFDNQSGEVDLLGYHEHLVNRVTVDDSGCFAVTASSDYNLYLWDLQRACLQMVLKGHSDDVEDFVFINEHKGASVSRDWRIIIWDLSTGAIDRILRGHQKDVLSINYANGKLYTTGDDMTLRTWDVDTGEQLAVLGPFETETDTCAIDLQNNRIVLGCDDGVVRVFDIQSNALIRAISGHSSAIKKVAVSPANGDILSAAYDQKIQIWDRHDFSLKQTLESHPALWERSFNFAPNGHTIVAGTFDGTVLTWDVNSGQLLKELGAEKDLRGNACFNDLASRGDDELALVSDDGHLRIASLTEQSSCWNVDHSPSAGRVLMNAVATCANSGNIITGSHNQQLGIYRQQDDGLSALTTVALNEGPINCIRASQHPDFKGDLFVACYSGNLAHLSVHGELINKISAHGNAIKALALHPEHPIGVSCCAEGGLTSWGFDGRILQQYKGHTAIIDDVGIDPSGRFIASAGRDFTLKIHRLDDGVLMHSIHLGQRSPKALCFVTPDTVIVTNYWGELLRVSLHDESVMRKTIAHNGLSAITLHGKHLAVSSYDGAVYLVEPNELDVVNTLRSMVQHVQAPAFA